jgi:CHAT domain-containing protein
MEKGDREKAFMLGERDRARWFLKKIGNPVWPRIPEEKVNAKIMAQIKGMKECAGLFQALSTSSSQEDSLLASHPGPAIDGTLALALRGRGERGDAGARKRARAFSGPGRALSHLPAEYIEQYKKKYMEILPLLKLENREYHSVKTIAPTPLKEIQACLDDHSLLLEYYIDRHRIYLFALTPTEITCHSLPYSQEALIDKIASFRQKIIQEAESGKNAYTPGVLTHARALYTILLKPVEKELEGKKRIVLVPHRELHDLPFAALVDGKDMPLAKTYSFCYLPSASALPLCREKTLKKKSTNTPDLTAFALGNVVMEGFSPLPGTNDEVKKLKEIFPSATISLEKNFTLDQVARLAPGATYLHLATHGITDMENPHFSGILASDGILFVDDIFGSLNLHNCQLATLSACQTARGKIPQRDERIAVSRALFYAGAPAIVVSLWNVSDESTSKLMVYFYEYLKTGMAKDEALEKAEQRLMEAYPQPYHWASFILMGDWESSAPGGKTPGDTRN